MRYFFFTFLGLFLFFSCSKKTKLRVDVSNIDVEIDLHRFDVDFYTSTLEDLPNVKRRYPFLFPTSVADSIWIAKINDKQEQELFLEVQKVFKSTKNLELHLKNFYQHVKYYFPNYREPPIYTVLNNIDYNYRVIYGEKLLISLDVFLGENHPFYNDYPKYIRERRNSDYIIVEVAKKFIEQAITQANERFFLFKMIEEGKKMYLLDALLPLVDENKKLGYSKQKLLWAKENEEQIWKYFIEKDLLYSSDSKLNQRFLDDAPFSKFYLQEDTKSPGQIGRWIGWQIIRDYMENNDVSLQSVLKTKAEIIFKKSYYKPRG